MLIIWKPYKKVFLDKSVLYKKVSYIFFSFHEIRRPINFLLIPVYEKAVIFL